MKSILLILNANGGGASQGYYEWLSYITIDSPYNINVIIPNKPSEEKILFFKQNRIKWHVLNLPWWNRNTNLPLYYSFILFCKNQIKTIFRIKTIFKVIQIIRQNKIDIVYTGTILNIEGSIAAKITGKPHIWHIKETFGPLGRIKFWVPFHISFNWILYSSKTIIVMTKYIKSHFLKYQRNEKIKIVYDGIDFHPYQLDQNSEILRMKFGVKTDELLIGMVASLSSTWKNHKLFIDAAEKLICNFSELKFVAFGPEPQKTGNKLYDIPYEYYVQLQDYASKKELGDNFIWAGFCENIPQLFQSIDILVHPCETEPFGRIVIESLAANKLVIVPSQGGAMEPIKDEITGLIYEKNNLTDLVFQLNRIIQDKELFKKIKTNTKNIITDSLFDIKIYAQIIEDILIKS